MMRVTLFIGLVSLFSIAKSDCQANNCLRAVRNTQRPGSADCSSFLRSTFTPAEITLTTYSTASAVLETTLLATQTDTTFETLTNTVKSTLTVVAEATVTQTVFDPNLKKRQQPSALPIYASPCNVAEYISACSCIGVTGPIIATAPTPSTILTIPTTVTFSTKVETTTVATETLRITDATKIVTEVDSTVTLPTTLTVTTNLPIAAFCKDTIQYFGAIAHNDPTVYIGVPIGGVTPLECCAHCYASLNCLSFVAFPSQNSCTLLILRSVFGQTTPQCPLGVRRSDFQSPGNTGGFGKGPCQIPT